MPSKAKEPVQKKANKPDQIKFKYKFPDNYNPVYVNGAFGGITANGELVLNFYLERHALPVSQTMELLANGQLGNEVGREPEDLRASMVRYIGPGIVLSPLGAEAIYRFLEQQLNAMKGVASTAAPAKEQGDE
jgi:hypothetical protein